MTLSRFATVVLAAASLFQANPALPQTLSTRALVTQAVNDSHLATLKGNTRPEIRTAVDSTPVADDFPLSHMLLQLKRAPEAESTLLQLIDELHDPKSPNFHKWLTSDELGTSYGVAESDLTAITSWLASHGLRVNHVYSNRMVIDFSGTAAQVRQAFKTEIRSLDVDGVTHFANASDPQIPEALVPALAGIVSLHSFVPQPQFVMRNVGSSVKSADSARLHGQSIGTPTAPARTAEPSYFTGGNQAVAPGDISKIYNFDPLFAQGYTGRGQRIAVLQNTNMYDPADWLAFRTTFGLATAFPDGKLTTLHPVPLHGPNNCDDPGVYSPNDMEATLDAEWASAAAPSAEIIVASCADTATFGGLIALQNLLDSSTPPSVISISYALCESFNGDASNYAYRSAYQQAAAQGVSVYVAAGDWGASTCTGGLRPPVFDSSATVWGLGVNALAATPFNVAVGGTEFSDVYTGTTPNYWAWNNSANFVSALSYVPETPWNQSCANTLMAKHIGFNLWNDLIKDCNTGDGALFTMSNMAVAGGGGPSSCATGQPTNFGLVDGTCKGYPKPAWQNGIAGVANDGVRGLPDISLFSGAFGHYYVVCWSNPAWGFGPCSGAPNKWAGAGGTSVASPILAGLQALINQKWGSRQGNPNYRLYELAATQFSTAGTADCDSGRGRDVANDCVFYDVTSGTIELPCLGPVDCHDGGPPSHPAAIEIYDPASNAWSTQGSLNTARIDQTAVLLQNGNLLIAGGNRNDGYALNTAETFDPTTGISTYTGQIEPSPYATTTGHAATALQDGRALLVGGSTYNASLPKLYNPATRTWSYASQQTRNLFTHTVTLLNDGRVLVAGGYDMTGGAYTSAAEIYDPETNTWMPTGNLAAPRAGHTATLLSSGKVLVTGGISGPFIDVATAELFDPVIGAWGSTASMSTPRGGHTATLLKDGRIMVTGGASLYSGKLASAEIFEPSSQTWNVVAPLQTARTGHAAQLLDDGSLLVAGGGGVAEAWLASAERYNPNTNTWSDAGRLSTGRSGMGIARLPDMRVVVAGGYGLKIGLLSTRSDGLANAFDAHAGWDFATGLGSVNAYNLLMKWGKNPLVSTNLPSNTAATRAVLSGTVSANGAPTLVTFEYGKSPSYGNSAAAAQGQLGGDARGIAVSAAISGLACETTYHFRIKAESSAGTTYGNDQTFTTAKCAKSLLPSILLLLL